LTSSQFEEEEERWRAKKEKADEARLTAEEAKRREAVEARLAFLRAEACRLKALQEEKEKEEEKAVLSLGNDDDEDEDDEDEDEDGSEDDDEEEEEKEDGEEDEEDQVIYRIFDLAQCLHFVKKRNEYL
jgi:hypothetical protein